MLLFFPFQILLSFQKRLMADPIAVCSFPVRGRGAADTEAYTRDQ